MFLEALLLLQTAGAPEARRPAKPAPNLPAREVGLGQPKAVVTDGQGNLYVAAPELSRVVKIDRTGLLSVIAGLTRPSGLARPVALALDSQGNLFIADRDDRLVRRLDAKTGAIATVLGASAARLQAERLPFLSDAPIAPRAPDEPLLQPAGLACDAAGNLYVSDAAANVVLRVSATSKIVLAVAGMGASGFTGDGGPATTARLANPAGLAIDRSGSLYIADRGNHRIRRVDVRTGVITTVAGDGFAGSRGDGGRALSAQLDDPVDVAIDARGDVLIADLGNRRVRRIDTRSGIIETLTGLAGTSPAAVAATPSGDILVADMESRTILRRSGRGSVDTVAGNGGLGYAGDAGPATSAYLKRPEGIARDAAGNLFIADAGAHRVRRIDARTGRIATIAGNGRPGFSGDGEAAAKASLSSPSDVAIDATGQLLIADSENHRIRRVDNRGSIATIAGNGRDGFGIDGKPALETELARPSRLAVAGDGSVLVVQGYWGLIRRIDASTGVAQIVAGRLPKGVATDPQPTTARKLEGISAFAMAADGSMLVAERDASRIWRIAGGRTTLEAGRGVDFGGDDPMDARNMGFARITALASAGSDVYLGEIGRGLRRIDTLTHRVSPVAGEDVSSLLFLAPDQILISTPAGFVRRFGPRGAITTVAGGGFGF